MLSCRLGRIVLHAIARVRSRRCPCTREWPSGGQGLVGVAGFEPATPSSRTRCATRLRYTPPEGRSYNPCRRTAASYRPPMTAQPATQVIEASDGAITPGAAAVARAARTLAAGGLVAFPTETVYG